MNRFINYCFIIVILVVSLSSCAKRGQITGGLKDSIPPILTNSFPKNKSIDFNSNEIKLTFDEYVKLKDVSKQLIVSPPMKNAPIITPTNASKRITIKLKDTLLPNTTYSFNFGNSIQDNNEGIPYQQFKYVFSTGSYIDSLTLEGTIKDAYNKEVDNFVSVMLYEKNEKFTDSIVYKENPTYITNTLDSLKTFRLENLKAGNYMLVAMKDYNSNFKFDPKRDKIGFYNKTVTLPDPAIYELELFKEQLPFKAFKPIQTSGNTILIGYEGKADKSVVKVKNEGVEIPTKITKFPKKDSLQVWFSIPKVDSLQVSITKEVFEKSFYIKIKNQKPDSLKVSPLQSGTLEFRDKFTLLTETPLEKIDASKITLLNKDSLQVAFTTEYDEFNKKLEFNFTKEPLEKYSLTLLPGALLDMFGKASDSLKYKFSTKSTSEYGNLRLLLQNVKSFPLIVELTNKKGETQAMFYAEKETKVDFDYLKPDFYTIRIIYDENKNKVWDSGSYLEKRQTEEVIYFPKEIDVRANWDVEQTVDLGSK